MGLTQKIKLFDCGCINYTNLFGIIGDTYHNVLRRKQTTHILHERFVRGNKNLHVVPYS
mgnify:CR=1 FL=1